MINTSIYENYDSIPSLVIDNLNNFYSTMCYSQTSQIAKGENLKIGIVDSGIDIFNWEICDRIIKGYNVINQSEINYFDKIGHGTSLAGIIAGSKIGLLKNTNLYIARVTDDYGKTTFASVADGIKWCINENVDIICIALGSPVDNEDIYNAIKVAYERNIIILASAGNNAEEILYPAKYNEVISVGSIDFLKMAATFNTPGLELDIVLPAVNVPSIFLQNKYIVANGSSIATAIATGYIGLIQDLKIKKTGSKFSNIEIMDFLKNNTIDLGRIGLDEIYGYGIPTLKNLHDNEYVF